MGGVFYWFSSSKIVTRKDISDGGFSAVHNLYVAILHVHDLDVAIFIFCIKYVVNLHSVSH